MTIDDMLALPVEHRRGAGPREGSGATYVLIDAGPDAVVDALIADGVIGAARRDCVADLEAKRVPRPVGPWGALVRLKGQPWSYVVSWDLRWEWPHEWAAKHGWRTAMFTWGDGVTPTVARHYDGARCVFDFYAGLKKEAEPGHAFRADANEFESFQIGGEDGEVCNVDWLNDVKNGEDAADRLARRIDAYLPLYLWASEDDDDKTIADVGGWEGDPHAGDNDGPVEDLPADAFERIDIFTLGAADTLEPSAAQTDLTKAVRADDPDAIRAALAAGADANVMADDSKPPLYLAMWPDDFKTDGSFTAESRERYHGVLSALLDGGASLQLGEREYAIHHAIERLQHSDELTLLRVIGLLLDHAADPNARGADFRTTGLPPLHLIAYFHPTRLATAKLLVARGADVTATDRKNRTARQVAEERLTYIQKSQGDLTDAEPEAMPDEHNAAAMLGGLLGGGGGKKAMANLMELAQAEGRNQSAAEQRALAAMIAFFASVERGEAEPADVDALLAAAGDAAEADRQRRAADKAKAEQAAKEAFAHWDLPPAERRQRSKQLREERAANEAAEPPSKREHGGGSADS